MKESSERVFGTEHGANRESSRNNHASSTPALCLFLYVHVFSSILQLALIAVKRRARRKEKQMRFVHKESKGLRSEATMKASLLPVFASVSECEWEREAFVNTKTEAGRSRMLPSRDTGSEVNAVSLSGRCAWVLGV